MLGSARSVLVPVECQLDDLQVIVGRRPSMTVIVPANVHSDTEGQDPGACDSRKGQQCRNRPRYKLHARNILIGRRSVKALGTPGDPGLEPGCVFRTIVNAHSGRW